MSPGSVSSVIKAELRSGNEKTGALQATKGRSPRSSRPSFVAASARAWMPSAERGVSSVIKAELRSG